MSISKPRSIDFYSQKKRSFVKNTYDEAIVFSFECHRQLLVEPYRR